MTWAFDTAAIAVLSTCNVFAQLIVASWLQFPRLVAFDF